MKNEKNYTGFLKLLLMKSDTHPETSPEKAEGRVDIGNWLGKRSR